MKRGDCYEAAGQFVLDHRFMTLVHGTCTGTGPIQGIAFGHAWAEDGDLCFDVANGHQLVIRKELYYAIGKCRDVVTYPGNEVPKLLLTHKHWGPWHTTTAAHHQRQRASRKSRKSLTPSKPLGKRVAM